MINIKPITAESLADASIKNEPFTIWGRLIPSLKDGEWKYTTATFEPSEMCFPDFPYDPASDDACFIGAYDEESCIGLAVLRKDMFKYLYLDDLKVNRSHRRTGVGKMLIDACMDRARAENMRGVYTIAQDNNLSACLFYLKNDFEIGGFDNRVYRGTSEEDNANIIFYRDAVK